MNVIDTRAQFVRATFDMFIPAPLHYKVYWKLHHGEMPSQYDISVKLPNSNWKYIGYYY